MKAHERIKAMEPTKRQLELIDVRTFDQGISDYLKTLDQPPMLVLLVDSNEGIFHTSAESLPEMATLINLVDVKYVYETDTKLLYKVMKNDIQKNTCKDPV